MEIRDNDAPGKSVILVAGDDLADVPKSHSELVSPMIREVFADPPAYLKRLIRSCPFAAMAKWLRALVEEGEWELTLHRGHVPEWASAAFTWYSSEVLGAAIAPSLGPPSATLPAALQSYYSLMDTIDWMDFAYAGGLYGASTRRELPVLSVENPGQKPVPSTVYAFGSNQCGDELVYSADGRAGWRSHESGTVHFLGTIEDAINWVFGELCSNRCPDWIDN